MTHISQLNDWKNDLHILGGGRKSRKPLTPVVGVKPYGKCQMKTMPPNPPLKIQFLTAGGTIDKVYFDAKSEFQVGPPQVLTVLRDANVTFEYSIESLLRKDSLEMNDEDRHLIRHRVAAEPCTRIVITHGTDTMIQTARSLAGITGKTIVLTGSMQPAKFRMSDAALNIGTAIGAVQSLPPGIYIAMNGQVFDPYQTRKNRDKNCFESAP